MALSYSEPAISVADADAYASARGWADWIGEGKAEAILRAQTYIAATYNGRWLTEWVNEEAPEAVKFAIIEAARRELARPGSLAPDYDPFKVVTNKRVKAGPVETQTAYADPKGAKPTIPIIDQLLAGLLAKAAGNTAWVLRA